MAAAARVEAALRAPYCIQCRDRYNQHAKPELKKGKWTSDEYESLVVQHCAGEGSWARVAKVMGTGRSDNDLKNKFNAMSRKQHYSDEELTGAPSVLVQYIKELHAVEENAPTAALAQQQCHRQRARSEDSDSGSTPETTAAALCLFTLQWQTCNSQASIVPVSRLSGRCGRCDEAKDHTHSLSPIPYYVACATGPRCD
jgi:hypothetical protein